jgi:hypothetical protein
MEAVGDNPGPIQATRKTVNERFLESGADAGFDLLSFWGWSVSDLINNATRGVLAEFIVAPALGLAHEESVKSGHPTT